MGAFSEGEAEVYTLREVAAKLKRRPRTLARVAVRQRMQALYGMPPPRLGRPLAWPKAVFDHWFLTGTALTPEPAQDLDARDRAGLGAAYGEHRP